VAGTEPELEPEQGEKTGIEVERTGMEWSGEEGGPGWNGAVRRADRGGMERWGGRTGMEWSGEEGGPGPERAAWPGAGRGRQGETRWGGVGWGGTGAMRAGIATRLREGGHTWVGTPGVKGPTKRLRASNTAPKGLELPTDESFTVLPIRKRHMSVSEPELFRVWIGGDLSSLAELLSGRGPDDGPTLATESVDASAWNGHDGDGSRDSDRSRDGDSRVDCLLLPAAVVGEDRAVSDADRDVEPDVPVVVLADGDYGHGVRRTTTVDAAETLPREFVTDDPDVAAERLVSVVRRNGGLARNESDTSPARSGGSGGGVDESSHRPDEQREKYSTLVEQSSDGVVVVQDGEYVFVNERFAEITGYDRESLVGRPFDGVFTSEYRDLVRERYRRRVAGESPPSQYDVEIETADGEVRTLSLAVSSVDHGGEPATMGTFRDVTDRKRRERAVRALQSATDRMQDAETAGAVAEIAVEAARDALDLPLSMCWFHDAGAGAEGKPRTDADADTDPLVPVAATDAIHEEGLYSGLSADRYEYDVFREGTVTTYSPRERAPANPLESAVLLPLGEHGLVAAGRHHEVDYDETTLDVARALAEHTTTALDRIARASEVREREHRLRLIAEHIDQAIYLAAPDFSEVVYVNDAYEDIWGRPVDELHADPTAFVEHIDPRDRADFESEFAAMRSDIDGGDPDDVYEFEFRVRHPDGDVRWVHATGHPVATGDGTVYVGTATDVTERRELERTYRSVFENVSDGLVVHDPVTGEITDVNDRFCGMTGYGREELVGETVDRITPPDYEYERAQEYIDAAREEGPQLFEWRNERADGTTYPVEVHLSVVQMRGEERVLASVRDITERKRREREYEQIFDGVNDAIVVQDPETAEPLDANQPFLDRLGYDDVEEIRRAGLDGLSATDAGYTKERARELCQRVVETGESETVEWQQETRDGDRRWIEAKVDSAEIGGQRRVLSMQRDVTERKRREHEYEQIFNAVNDIVNVYDPETGDLVDVNDTLCAVTGYDRERILEEGLDLVSATDEGYSSDRARDLIAEVVTSGESRELTWQLETADGEPRWLDVKATPATIGGEERVLTISRDVTERRRREREYEQIFDGVNDAITVHDPETAELLDVNETFCELLGYDREEILEMGVAGYTSDAFGPSVEEGREFVREVVDSGEPGQTEWAVETRDGETRWMEIKGTTAEIGGELRYISISRDVTQRRRREREYEQVFDGVTDAITVHDPETGALVDVNRTMCELTGYDQEALLTEGEGQINVPEEGYSTERARRIVREVMAEGEPRTFEWLIQRADGERRWLEVNATPATLGGEERYLAIMRDVTERRRSERRLRTILDRIDEAIYLNEASKVTEASQSPDYVSSGYEAIWGQPLEGIRDTYEEGFFGTLHPDDEAEYRAFVEELVRDVEDGVAADSYSLEYRIRRSDGELRWVQSDYYPVEWRSGPPRLVIVSRDVTDRKEREQRIASFEEATEGLATADDPEEAARLAVDAATDTLGLSAVGAFLYDDDAGVLSPEVLSDGVPEGVGTQPVGPGDGPLWEAFATSTVVDPDGAGTERARTADGGVAGEADGLADWRAVALGNHGVLLVGAPGGTLDPNTLQAAHVLAATLEAALNHLQGQQRLADQEEALRTQTERADRLDRIARLTQDVEAAITEASEPTEVNRAVCERLAGSGPYAAAWVGGVDVGADRLTARAVVGADRGYVDGLDLATTDGSVDPHPAVRAWDDDDVAVADSLVGGGPAGDWRRRALAVGYQSLCAVPLTYDGITHGVLVVAATEPNAFGEREREVLGGLGHSVGYAFAAIERRRALETDETVELEFAGEGTELGFARLAREIDCEVRHERTVPREDGTVSVYVALDGDVPDGIGDVAGSVLSGTVEATVDAPDATVLEVVTGDWFGSELAEYGAVLREASATPGETTVVVEVSAGADVRSFVDRLGELASSLELVAKRQHRRQDRTPEELHGRLREELTDRQYEVLTTALSAGYFEWPRENDGSEVADRLGITQPTLNKHLRLGERKTFELLFGDG
jgi:PAS domain S-box-containing protein